MYIRGWYNTYCDRTLSDYEYYETTYAITIKL